MKKNLSFFIVVGAILLVLLALYLNTGQLIRDREFELSQLHNDDEMARILRAEAEDFREVNRKQRRGILMVGIVVVVISGVWWVGQRRRSLE